MSGDDMQIGLFDNDPVKMEYDELMKCAKIGDMKGWEENIYHLSVALLNAWRLYKHDGK